MITLVVNGQTTRFDLDADTPLLYVLRDNLALNGPKFGCGLGQCGACTVLMNGQAVRSCSVPIAKAAGLRITTLEGLGSGGKPHPIQKAVIDPQAAQCGYCINGMIMSSKALLERSPNPSDREIRKGLAANLSPCGADQRIFAPGKR